MYEINKLTEEYLSYVHSYNMIPNFADLNL